MDQILCICTFCTPQHLPWNHISFFFQIREILEICIFCDSPNPKETSCRLKWIKLRALVAVCMPQHLPNHIFYFFPNIYIMGNFYGLCPSQQSRRPFLSNVHEILRTGKIFHVATSTGTEFFIFSPV